MRRLDYQEVSDILTGCTILGTGGGGSLQSGLAAVEKEFGEGKEFKLLEFHEIQDEAWFTNPYFCGSIMPEGQEVQITGEEIPARRWLRPHILENIWWTRTRRGGLSRSFSFLPTM